MPNKNKGYVLLWRSIEDNDFLDDGITPFDRYHAWCDLICMVNHQDAEIYISNKPVLILRGQRYTSISKLAVRWHWSRTKVVRFLKGLLSRNMIKLQKYCSGTLVDTESNTKNDTASGTLITVVKYDFYNTARNGERNAKRYEKRNEGVAQTNNDRNNEKKENLSPWGGEFE